MVSGFLCGLLAGLLAAGAFAWALVIRERQMYRRLHRAYYCALLQNRAMPTEQARTLASYFGEGFDS